MKIKAAFSKFADWFKGGNSSASGIGTEPVADNGNPGVLAIGDTQYAIQLHWEMTRESVSVDSVARSRAKVAGIDADLYCVNETDRRQFGLGFKSKGHRKGMQPLATILVPRIEGNWLGLFEINGGWYLLGVLDNCVFAETDRWYCEALLAQRHYERVLLSMGNVDCYSESPYRDENSSCRSIMDLLDGASGARLRMADRWSPFGKWFAAAAVASMLLFGAEHYFGETIRDGLSGIGRTILQFGNSQSEEESAEQVLPPMPWEGRPHGLAALETCVKSIASFAATAPGWSVKQLLCDGSSVSARLNRAGDLGAGGGSVTWILPFVRRKGFEPEILPAASGSSDAVDVLWHLETSETMSDTVETVPLERVKTALFHAFESHLTTILFDGVQTGKHWREQKFRIATRFNPLYFSKVFGSVPVWLIGKVHYDMASAVWSLEGKYYEKFKSPIQKSG